jgi:hypothetical protein
MFFWTCGSRLNTLLPRCLGPSASRLRTSKSACQRSRWGGDCVLPLRCFVELGDPAFAPGRRFERASCCLEGFKKVGLLCYPCQASFHGSLLSLVVPRPFEDSNLVVFGVPSVVQWHSGYDLMQHQVPCAFVIVSAAPMHVFLCTSRGTALS